MGLHWFDVRSPELQAIGNPGAWQPFTRTFLIGSWAGEFIFDQPMSTRAYLLEARAQNRDEVIPLPRV